MADDVKPYLKALSGEVCDTPPVWFMRQAGRYLPEYRKVREKAGNFMKLVYAPDFAVEVTLQPIRRYGFDAAILFSDILVVPDALGQAVSFEEGHGPRLAPLQSVADLSVTGFMKHLEPVYAAVAGIKYALKSEGFLDTALIGFAGAPWTVACYMVEGSGSKEFARTRQWAYGRPEEFQHLIDLLTDVTTEYLLAQIRAGAESVQIFDSWAGLLPQDLFEKYVVIPTARIVQNIKIQAPHIPVIGFPKGAGIFYADYVAKTGVKAVSVDYQMPASWIKKELQKKTVVQGNLDPFALLAGGEALEKATAHILTELADGPFIFNLGHGIHKDTPPAHVTALVNQIRAHKRKKTG